MSYLALSFENRQLRLPYAGPQAQRISLEQRGFVQPGPTFLLPGPDVTDSHKQMPFNYRSSNLRLTSEELRSLLDLEEPQPGETDETEANGRGCIVALTHTSGLFWQLFNT